jgi:hypothetical protein
MPPVGVEAAKGSDWPDRFQRSGSAGANRQDRKKGRQT